MAGENESLQPVVSADDRFVAFTSYASDLVPGDSNGAADIFVRDRQAAATERVNLSSTGEQAQIGRHSLDPSISNDGRLVAFASDASNLVADESLFREIYVRDRATATTTRISVTSTGGEADDQSAQPIISGDGRYVAFTSHASNLVANDGNGDWDVFVRDLQTNVTRRVSVSSSGEEGDADSGSGLSLSDDGRYVTFDSLADNLVAGDTNALGDTFVHDNQTGTTERVSISSAGAQQFGPGYDYGDAALSADGRYVAFSSSHAGLVPGPLPQGVGSEVYLRDRLLGTTTLVSVSDSGEPAGSAWNPSLSSNGRFVGFVSDGPMAGISHSRENVFVRDLLAGKTRLASRAPLESPLASYDVRHSLAADGTFVVFSVRISFVPADGNTLHDVYATTVDTAAPETEITAGPSGTVASSAASIAFAASESPAEFACSLDGAPFAACSSPTDLSGLAVGSHSFRVRASDQAGNRDATAAVRGWTVVAPPPSPPPPPAPTILLHVTAGPGGVVAGPGGFSCGPGRSCELRALPGTLVELRETPLTGWRFAGWGGACASYGKASACSLWLDVEATASAGFDDSSFQPACIVPRLRGKRIPAARIALVRWHCRLGRVSYAYSSRVRRGRVVAQRPRAWAVRPPGARVSVVVSRGRGH